MKLPILIKTEMRSYPFLANYFGILEAHNIDTTNIKINHYISIHYKYFKGSLTFSEEKYIKSYFDIQNFYIENYNIQSIEKHIKNNEYVAIMIDGSKLNKDIELINHTHTYLIYGIEKSTQKIHLIGYLRDKTMNKYTSFTLTFDEFISTIPKMNDLKKLENNIMFNHFFKLKDKHKLEKIDYEYVKTQIIKSIKNNSIYKFKNHIILFHIIGKTINNRDLIDKRDFRVLFEYLKNINLLCNQNQQLKNLTKKTSDIVNLGNIALFLSAKYQIVNSKEEKYKIYKRIITILNNIILLEKEIKHDIIKCL